MAVEVETSRYIFHPKSTFSYNPLHDLESLWWVGVWFLFCHYQTSNLLDVTVEEHIKVVKEIGQRLFNNGAGRLSRADALIHSTLLAKESRPTRFPKTVRYFVLALDVFRAQLIKYYESYKPEEPQDRSFFTPDVHRKCVALFENALQLLENDKTELWPWDHIEKRITYLKSRRK